MVNEEYITESPILQGNIEIETLLGVEECRDKWTTYAHNGIPVPRMTEILSACIGKDYLVSYALRCKNYYEETNGVLYIGTLVHEKIDEFLLKGSADMTNIEWGNEEVFNKVNKAYNNFVRWYNDKTSEGYIIKTLDIEKKITSPWYGGTIDMIASVQKPGCCNSSNFVIDFKTSSKIAIDYLIQTYGYMWAVNWYRQYVDPTAYPQIDGIGIIRVDKKSKRYEDIFIENDDEFMRDIHNAFVSCLNWYYYQNNLAYIIKERKM